MKRFFVLFACLVCASIIKAQGINTYAHGTDVQAKAIDFNIKTGKATINGADVADQTLQQYFTADDYKMFKSGRTLYTSGTVISTIGAVPFGYCLGTMVAGGEVNTSVLLGGAVVMVSGLVIGYSGQNKMKKAIGNYNSSLALMPAVNWNSVTSDLTWGLALNISF